MVGADSFGEKFKGGLCSCGAGSAGASDGGLICEVKLSESRVAAWSLGEARRGEAEGGLAAAPGRDMPEERRFIARPVDSSPD